MHDDLIDGVRWAVDRDVADPKRVAIMGASYGGYSALSGAAFTPDVFVAAVDRVGISDMVSLIEDCLLFLVKTKYRRAIVAAQSNRGLAHGVSFLSPRFPA